jgi:hypothetical protein
MTAVGQWSGVVFLPSVGPCHLVVGWGMSSTSVDAAEDSGGSRMTTVARTVIVAADRFATWKVYCI